MNLINNVKLFFKYIYLNIPHLYLTQEKYAVKNLSVLISSNVLYFSIVHIRFSTIFYSNQLVDIFSYELPIDNLSSKKERKLIIANSIIVYNFHNLTSQERLFIFCINQYNHLYNFQLNSIADVFQNANWLEREVAELQGIVFLNKKDLRNLMLQYGDLSTPFKKSSPSIGTNEIFFDSNNDSLIQIPLTLQS